MKRRPLVASLVSSLAAILILAAACGEQSPTASRLEPTGAAASAGVGRRVTTLKTRYRAGHFSRTIGPGGGVLPFRIGSLIIPPGALSKATEITAYVNGKDLAVRFEPHGLEFRTGHEPTLDIGFRDVQLTGSALHIQYVDSWMIVQENLQTTTDPVANTARARIRHFSIYCLAE